MRLLRRVEKNQQGAVIVEFAVFFLLLMFLLFGILEFGFLWMQSHYINNAAREGARAAAKLQVDSDPVPVAESAVKSMLKGVYDDALVDADDSCCEPGKFINVVVNETTVDVDGVDLSAIEVEVDVRTADIWRPILWSLLNLLPGVDIEAIERIRARALFVREDQS